MKYALITGAARGIGRAIAIKLAREGYFILINYRSNDTEAQATLQAVREAGSDGYLLRCDVADREAFATGIAAWQQAHPDAYI